MIAGRIDFSRPDCMVMEVDGIESTGSRAAIATKKSKPFEVVQFGSSWAINEIPRAQVVLAVGRTFDNVDSEAEISRRFGELFAFRRVRVYLTLAEEPFARPGNARAAIAANGKQWRKCVFEGSATGFSMAQSYGKKSIVVNLVHWLVDLQNSSCVIANLHPSNPYTVLGNAIDLIPAGPAGTAISQTYLSRLAAGTTSVTFLRDIGSGLKTILTRLAFAGPPAVGNLGLNSCGPLHVDKGAIVKNRRAVNAFARIEGQGADASTHLPFRYGRPLNLEKANASAMISACVYDKILTTSLTTFMATNIWDKLVGEYCPQFGMAIVPRIRRALLIADTPLANVEAPWRTISAGEYDSLEWSANVERPLRAVITAGSAYLRTTGKSKEQIDKSGYDDSRWHGGCFVSEVEDGDGLVLYTTLPDWLSKLQIPANGSEAGGMRNAMPTSAVSVALSAVDIVRQIGLTPITEAQLRESLTPAKLGAIAQMYADWARYIHAATVLKGRVGTLSGSLRFDVAPGSNLRVHSEGELFSLPGQDTTSPVVYANVSRVSVLISAESASASTSFSLSEVRTAQENRAQGTGLDRHHFFGPFYHGTPGDTKIREHGCPLTEDDFEENQLEAMKFL